MTLQIIRTLHPPAPFLTQLAGMLTRAGYVTTPEDVQRRINTLPEEDRILLAIEGHTLMGYAHMHLSRTLTHADTVDIVAVLVHPEYRRRGIGRRLVTAAEAFARDKQRSRLRLCANVLESDLHAFFVSLGYQETSTLIEFIDTLQADLPAA